MFEILLRFVLVACTFFLSSNGYASTPAGAAASSEDALIQGIADFLKDRATANFLFTFEQEIKRTDVKLECYLPTLRKTIDGISLDQLSKHKSEIWRKLISDDLQNDVTILFLNKLLDSEPKIGNHLEATKEQNKILEEYWTMVYQYTFYAIQEASKDEFGQVKDEPKDKVVTKLISYLDRAARALKVASENHCLASDAIKNNTKQIEELKQGIVRLNSKAIVIDPKTFEKMSISDQESIDIFIDLARVLTQQNDDQYRKLDGFNTISVLAMVRLVQIAGRELEKTAAEAAKNKNESESKLWFPNSYYEFMPDVLLPNESIETGQQVIAFEKKLNETKKELGKTIYSPPNKKTMRYIQFFASLADAQSAAEVKTTLKTFALPAVSFGEKRQANHIFISSYVGLGSGKVIDPGYSTSNTAFYAPIGIEFPLGGLIKGRGWPNDEWGPISLMLAPFDFGYPITQKLRATDTSFTTSDIVSPSIAISYGIHDMPINWGIAYQTTRSNPLNGKRGEKIFVFVSFDMPLFVLY